MLEEGDHDDTTSELPEVDLLQQIENLSLNDDEHEEEMAKVAAKVMTRSNPVFNLDKPSSKISAVMKVFMEKVSETDDKAVFVSQWSSVLDLFEPLLQKAGIRYVTLTGKVPVKNRPEIIDQFERGRIQVMLLSLTAGGVGLNLSAANHLFMIDLHW